MENNNSGCGFSKYFAATLCIVFIVLKLCHVIDWPWLMVISPIWIFWILVVIYAIIKTWLEDL